MRAHTMSTESFTPGNSQHLKTQSQTVAVVDLGSNSFHLVLARIINKDVQILLKEKIKVRLAKGLNDDLVLDEESIQRGLKTLNIFAHTLDGFHPDDVNIIATYTLRVAKNAKDFFRRAKKILPYPINVVAGQEEARLIYQGVAHSMHFTDKRLVIDIGGGSTELIIGQGFEPLALTSRNVGCVNLSKQFFKDGNISKKQFKKAFLKVEQEVQPITKGYKKIGWQQCIGTSGTISALTEIAIANGFCEQHLSRGGLEKIKNLLLSFDHINDISLLGLTDDRRPVVVSGLVVLIAIFDMLNIESIEYCDKALREGALYEMEERMQHKDIRQRSVDSLITRLSVDTEHADRVAQTCKVLYRQLKKFWPLNQVNDAKLFLIWAAKLHEIGLHINSSSVHRHSAYIVANSPLPGFNQESQLLLTTLLRFHRKKIKPDELPEFSLFQQNDVIRLIVLFRLAVLLNQKRQNNFLPDLQVNAKDCNLELNFAKGWLLDKDLFNSVIDVEQQQIAKLGINLIVNDQ